MKKTMMNESLVAAIKTGQIDLIETLWLNVADLIMYKAKQYYHSRQSLCISRGVTIDDLYQVGYFALLQAIDYYPENSEHKFNTYLSYPLKIQFNTLVGTNRAKSLNDPSFFALTLDQKLSDEDDSTIADLIPDSVAEQAFENVLDELYQKELKVVLNRSFENISPISMALISDYYMSDFTFRGLAKKYNISPSRAKARINDSFRKIRNGKNSRILREYL